MKVIRTFVAVLIAEDLRRRVSEVQERLKKLAPDVKWVAPENFHVTLKFLGDVSEDALPDVFAAVDQAVQGFSPFDLSLSGLGAFPSPRKARVVWTGIADGSEPLRRLAASVDDALAELNFEKEDREFKSHITIGRVKFSKHLDRLAKGIGEIDAQDLGTQKVTSVAVMRSDLQREGPVYSPLRIIELP